MRNFYLILLSIIISTRAFCVQVIYVNKNSTGINNGTSWANAYTDLNAALSASSSGTEIWVAANTYTPDNAADRSKSFTLKNGVALLGGFSGTETTKAQRDFLANETILSGEIGNLTISTDNSYHVLYSSGNDATAMVDGFTVTKGYSGSGAVLFGGGIAISGGSPVISNCKFLNNQSTQWAGAAYSANANPLFDKCIFQNCSGSYYGGAIYVNQGFLTIKNSVFQSNTCPTSDCQGGAIYNYYGNLRIENSTFKSNTSTSFGGAIRNGFGTMTIINTKFQSNTATSDGGAIYSYSGTSNYIGCLFYYNTSGNGGGIAHYYAGLTNVTNCTFYNNSASIGGGLYTNNGGVKVTNCILWKNNDLNGEILSSQIIDISGTSSLIKYSIVEGITTPSANMNINADPLFDSPFTYDYRLQNGSPAIDAGTPDTNGLSLPNTDIDVNQRVQNSLVDIGAYEGGLATGLNSAHGKNFAGQIKIYPNPSVDGIIFIECDEEIEKVILVNTLGQTENHYSNKIQSDFHGLVNIRVETKKGTASTKIVLQ